jgi:hypothetical protein
MHTAMAFYNEKQTTAPTNQTKEKKSKKSNNPDGA